MKKSTNNENLILYKKFEDECLKKSLITNDYSIRQFGDALYRVKKEFEFMLNLNLSILRAGLKLGQIKNGRFEPSYALAHYLDIKDAKEVIDLSLNDANKYLKGETLKINEPDGWALVCYNGLALSFSKVSKNVLKNFYPKGLRLTYDAN